MSSKTNVRSRRTSSKDETTTVIDANTTSKQINTSLSPPLPEGTSQNRPKEQGNEGKHGKPTSQASSPFKDEKQHEHVSSGVVTRLPVLDNEEVEDPLPTDADALSDVDPDVSLHTVLTALPDDRVEDEDADAHSDILASIPQRQSPDGEHHGTETQKDVKERQGDSAAVGDTTGMHNIGTDDLDVSLPIPGTIALSRSPSNVLNSNGYREAVARFRKYTRAEEGWA
jgi:hypothetical protein